jgi:chromosome segregation ATPase
MGITTKIVYGSLLTISIILLFLIFSMQNSAQLAEDMESIEQSLHQKDQKVAAIQQQLEAAVAAMANAESKSTVIPELKSSIEASEKEKLVYVQQLDELQEQLQEQLGKADKQLSELERLQDKYNQQEILLAEKEKAQHSAEMQTAKNAEQLKIVQKTLSQREKQISQFDATLGGKDLLIKSIKEEMKQTTEEISLLQSTLAENHLNLNIVLDELGLKNHAVKQLTLQIEEINSAIKKKGMTFDELIDDKAAIETKIRVLLETATSGNNLDRKDEISACNVALKKKGVNFV